MKTFAQVVKVRTEEFINNYKKKGKVVDQWMYFNRPHDVLGAEPHFDTMLFLDFFKQYRKILLRTGPFAVIPDDHIVYGDTAQAAFPHKIITIKPRDVRHRVISRVATVSHTASELFHLRRILLHEPVRSFEEARHGFATFQEAAVAAGYVTLLDVFAIFDELQGLATPKNCRNMFVTLTIEGYPTLRLIKAPNGRIGSNAEIDYDPKYYLSMTGDYRADDRHFTEPQIIERFLSTLEFSFKARGEFL